MTQTQWNSREEIAERCIALVTRCKTPPLEGVTLNSSFEDLGLDSLDKINLSFEVEDVFSIQIPDDAINHLRAVQDIVDGVQSLLEQRNQ